MEMIESGISTDSREEQLLNTLSPMEMTESGIETDVSLPHPQNAPSQMVVTVSEMEQLPDFKGLQ